MTLLKETIEPEFSASEDLFTEIGDIKQGQKIKAILNYKVIEKTKSFAMLRIGHIQIKKSIRKL